ncbi:MAG TPA: hypothetical protein VG755_20565 [Nannocystaceae bacterium]|nr:hypothetical protein [Nannocystaceae bacterium]
MSPRVVLLVSLTIGCAPRGASTVAPAPAATPVASTIVPEPRIDAAAQLAELEQRLLAAERVQLTFDVTAHGVVEAQLRGILIVERGKVARIDVSGTFAGVSGDASMSADARVVKGTSGTKRFEVARPPELDAALLIGLVRMGVLHNVALLWGGRPPDHGEGGVAEWVTTNDHARAELDGGDDGIGFGITVEGQPVGDAKLVLDASGWPARREQTVRLPAGEMVVTERYEAVEVK